MTDHTIIQEIAENWMLVGMFTFFIGAILWAFRPGSRAVHQETSAIPFRNDECSADGRPQARELQR